MVGIGPIVNEIQEFTKDKGYITEHELSEILINAKLPRVLIPSVYDELSKVGIRVLESSAIKKNPNDTLQEANNEPQETVHRLQKRVQKYRDRNEEFDNEDGETILKEFYTDLARPRMQYSYFPLVFLAFFDRNNIADTMSMSDMIQYFKTFYKNRAERGLIVEKKASIFVKGSPTDSEIKRLILFNPLGRSCLIKYFRYDKNTDMVYLNGHMYNTLTEYDVDTIIRIAKNLLNNYYKNLENESGF